MTYRELEIVVLIRDVPEHGLRAGDLGGVVHVHSGETLEVEFVRPSGHMQAVVTLRDTDVRSVQESDLIAIRSLGPTRGAA